MNDLLLREQLACDEGKRLVAYRDSNGYWTIGVGHLLGASPRMSSITEDECEALLDHDIDAAFESVKRVFPEANLYGNFPRIEGARLRALVNMMFNRGEQHMRQSTTITPAIKAALVANIDHDIAWQKVADAIDVSPWAAQVGARAARIATMLQTGVDA